VALTVLAMSTLFAQLVIVQRVRMTPRQMIVAGCGSMILGASLFALSLDFSALIFGLVLIGLGLGLSRPGIMGAASLSAGRAEQGAVTGLVGGMGAASFMVIPILMALLYARDPSLMFVALMVLAGLVIIVTLVDPAFKSASLDFGLEDETEPPPMDV
jgi:MFS family permease